MCPQPLLAICIVSFLQVNAVPTPNWNLFVVPTNNWNQVAQWHFDQQEDGKLDSFVHLVHNGDFIYWR